MKAKSPELIKIGRSGIVVQGRKIPASFFRHSQPGKRFVVLDQDGRRLMHVRACDRPLIRAAYLAYLEKRNAARKRRTTN